MTLEEAIKTAINYETKVRDVYLDNVDSIADKTGRQVFQTLGDEEQGHLDYLNARLEEWRETGKVSPCKLETVVPACDVIEKGIKKQLVKLRLLFLILSTELDGIIKFSHGLILRME